MRLEVVLDRCATLWHSANKPARIRRSFWRRHVIFSTTWLVMAGTAAKSPAASTHPQIPTDFQVWNELDVSTALADHVDATWVTQTRLSTELRNPAVSQSGIEVPVSTSSHLTLTPSYYYVITYNASGHARHRNEPKLAITASQAWHRFTISDRNRIVDIYGSGQRFWVYQNRPRVDFRLGPERWGLSQFVWDEVSYRSDSSAWARNRLAVGARTTVDRKWNIELYYLHQNNTRSQPYRLNGIGLTLELRAGR